MNGSADRDATHQPDSSALGRQQPVPTHRVTIAVPRPLVAEALEVGRRCGLPSLSAVVQVALEEFTERRRRGAFAAAMAEMGSDPEIVRESGQITRLFEAFDTDGLG